MLAQDPPWYEQLTQAITVKESPESPSVSLKVWAIGEFPSTNGSELQVVAAPNY